MYEHTASTCATSWRALGGASAFVHEAGAMVIDTNHAKPFAKTLHIRPTRRGVPLN